MSVAPNLCRDETKNRASSQQRSGATDIEALGTSQLSDHVTTLGTECLSAPLGRNIIKRTEIVMVLACYHKDKRTCLSPSPLFSPGPGTLCATCVLMCYLLSRVRFFVTPWTVAHRLLCPWGSPDKNTGADCHSLLQRYAT